MAMTPETKVPGPGEDGYYDATLTHEQRAAKLTAEEDKNRPYHYEVPPDTSSKFGIDDKVISGNQFWEGGETFQFRLDEINAMNERRIIGDQPSIGDTSPRELVEQFFKRCGILGNRLIPELTEVFAWALVKWINEHYDGNPTLWVNPLANHPARDISRYTTMDTRPEGNNDVSGYPKPTTDEELSASKKRLEDLKAKVTKERDLTPQNQTGAYEPKTVQPSVSAEDQAKSDDAIKKFLEGK